MRTWTATTTARAQPEDVLDALTDPEACRRWAPVAFEVEDGARLCAGSRRRVRGGGLGLPARRVEFDVEIHRADSGGLELSAVGPVCLDVAYRLAPCPGGTDIAASIRVRPGRGLIGTLLAEATNGLLRAGALTTAVDRLARLAAV